MLDCFAERQQALLAELGDHPDQQFAFLKSLLAIHQGQQVGAINGNGSSNTLLKVGIDYVGAGFAGFATLMAGSRQLTLLLLLPVDERSICCFERASE